MQTKEIAYEQLKKLYIEVYNIIRDEIKLWKFFYEYNPINFQPILQAQKVKCALNI